MHLKVSHLISPENHGERLCCLNSFFMNSLLQVLSLVSHSPCLVVFVFLR